MFDLASYQNPESLDQALEMLAENPSARPIAGGTDALIRLREGKGEFRHLVDIHGLEELRGVGIEEDGALFIGSGTTFTDLMGSELIADLVPILARASATVAGPQIRNMATLGGNICNGAPSADGAAPLLVLEAELVIRSPQGERNLPLREFYLGPMKVDLDQAEILTGFRIAAKDYQGWSAHYHKYAMRQAMDIATIGCAAACRTEPGEDGKVRLAGLRLAYIVAGPTPLRCLKTEAAVLGSTLEPGLLDRIAGLVMEDLSPRDSWRAAKDFREHIIATLARRVTAEALRQNGAAL
jgi:xanthine dehydrogenase FAD-binding subunit